MITTISLVKIITSHSYRLIFPVMRIFKVCSLSDFQIYNVVFLTIVTMLYITCLGLIYLKRTSISSCRNYFLEICLVLHAEYKFKK